jgi:hypothetical protein
LGPTAIEPLLAEVQERRERLTGLTARNLPYLLFCALYSVAGFVPELKAIHDISLVLFGPLTILFCWLPSRRYKQIADFVVESADVQSVGILAESAHSGSSKGDARARAALRRILPRLKASDTHVMTDVQRLSLYASLTNACAVGDKSCVLATIQAIGQIGDEKTLSAVCKVQQWAVKGQATDIVDAVRECLALLEQRVSGGIPHRLLRPAQPCEFGVLLRLMESSTGADSVVLLRVSENAGMIGQLDRTNAAAIQGDGFGRSVS